MRKTIYRRVYFNDEDLKKAAIYYLKSLDSPIPTDIAVTLSWLPAKEEDGYELSWQEIQDVK